MTTSALKSLQAFDILVDKISSLTGLTRTEISKLISTANIPSYQFKDTLLVAPEDFASIIDNWAAKIKTSLGLGRQESIETTHKFDETIDQVMTYGQTLANSGESASTPLVEDPQAPVSLSWPEGFQTGVSHLYGPSLKRILPQDLAQRRLYLEAIAQETEAGSALVEELAMVIAQKYGGPGTLSEEKAMLGIIKKATAMLKDI